MKPFSKLSHSVPKEFLNDWRADSFQTFKARLLIMGVTAIAGFAVIHMIHAVLTPAIPLEMRAFIVTLFTAANLVLIFISFQTKTTFQTKLVGYLVTASILAFFVFVQIHLQPAEQPYAFTTTAVIALFFIALMLPWAVVDVFVLGFLTLVALTAFHMELPVHFKRALEVLFANELYLDGIISVLTASLFCVVVRSYDNARTKKNFILLKTVQLQKKKIEVLNNQVNEELALARRIHETLIPKSFENDHLAVRVTSQSVSEIGGDYANFCFLDHKTLLFLMSDVTGHGIPAALVVNRFESEFQRLAQSIKQPGEVMRELNQFMLEHFSSTGMYLTAFCGLLDLENGKLTYTNYGHPDQYLLKKEDQTVTKLSQLTTMVGADESPRLFEEETTLDEGDQLVLFTDGVLEVKNKEGEIFGPGRLVDAVSHPKRWRKNHPDQAILSELKKYKAGDFQDDLFILSIKFKQKAAAAVHQ